MAPVLCCAAACLLLSVPLGAAEPMPQEWRPADTGAALVNPGMGWTLYHYATRAHQYGARLAPSDTVEDFPGVSTVYLRVPWAFLEPEEGRYAWELLDTPAQRWIARGKRIALRVTCSESWMRHATPAWVQAAGAQGVEYEFSPELKARGMPPAWEPDFLDPVFLAKLDRFLAAFGRRYDGNPSVAYVDVGTFGLWGEGHTLMSSKLDEATTLAAARVHIDLHRRHLPRTQLAISDDVVGPRTPGAHFPATDYALAQGVTLRDDSILVRPAPNHWFHAEMAQAFWPTLPVILEHEHYGTSVARGAWDPARLEQAVEDYHASYLSVHWWPREFLAENRAAIERINRRLGYRLQLRSLRFPAELAPGRPFAVEAVWANAGVAPCLPGGQWAVTLTDAAGGIAAVLVDADWDVRALPVAAPGAAPEQVRRVTWRVGEAFPDPRAKDPSGAWIPPRPAPGDYSVHVSVGRADGTPLIALPLANDDGQHRYRVGSVRIAAP